MTKVIEFTTEEKSLIWTTKVAFTGATSQDAEAFVMVCEEYGLNPLTGDIVFQRYVTKTGPKVSYTVTRDGYLKHVYRQNDFVSINAGVVRQGDHFKFDLKNEIVEHDFNAERGPVIGAWAVLKTKNRGNIMDFADYNEYKEALGGKNNLWFKMPSAMIKKVAQSTVIRMAFPLGVDFHSEDEIGWVDNPSETIENQEQSIENAQNKEKATLVADLQQAKDEATTSNKPQKTEENPNVKQQPILEKPEKVKVETPKVPTPVKEKEVDQKTKPISETITKGIEPAAEEVPTETAEIAQEKNVQTGSMQEETVSKPANENAYIFESSSIQMSPSTNEKFLTIRCNKNGSPEILLAAEDAIFEFDEFTEGIVFEPTLREENGFKFVESVQVVA